MVDFIINGNTIQNQIIVLKDFENNVATRFVSASVFSSEKKQILVQHTGNIYFNELLSNKYIQLINDLKKITPYLNKQGRQILSDLYNENNSFYLNEMANSGINSMLKKLAIDYFQLSNTELLFCALITLNYSNTEMSSFTGQTLNAIRVNIHRICKKLHFDSRTELQKELAHHYRILEN